MIDFSTETVIDLKRQAPKYLGPSRNGRPVHHSFLVRAVTRGVNGVTLEAVRVGSRWLTSVEALQRWAERQAAARDSRALPPRSPTRRARDDRRAAERLKGL